MIPPHTKLDTREWPDHLKEPGPLKCVTTSIVIDAALLFTKGDKIVLSIDLPEWFADAWFEQQPEPGNIVLNTDQTIYICTDGPNAEVKLLLPRGFKTEVVELNIGSPDPECTDAAEYKLLATEMDEHTYEV